MVSHTSVETQEGLGITIATSDVPPIVSIGPTTARALLGVRLGVWLPRKAPEIQLTGVGAQHAPLPGTMPNQLSKSSLFSKLPMCRITGCSQVSEFKSSPCQPVTPYLCTCLSFLDYRM